MAIDKQAAPLDSPASLTDWQRLIDITDTLALSFKNPWPVKVVTGTGYIIHGSVFYIGGAWYKANVDVAITGSITDYIQLTVDNINNLVTAEYVATLTDVSWNDQWNGWYDITGKFYVFDENVAYGAGLIDFPRTVAYSRPKNAESAKAASTVIGNNWANFLAGNVDPLDRSAITFGLPNSVYTNYNDTIRVVKASRAFPQNSWVNIYTITISVDVFPDTIEAIRFMWKNDSYDADNYVRIMEGKSTQIAIWSDATRNTAIDVTGLNITSNKTWNVQYANQAGSYFDAWGPFTLTASVSSIDGTRKPNLFEVLHHLIGGPIQIAAL